MSTPKNLGEKKEETEHKTKLFKKIPQKNKMGTAITENKQKKFTEQKQMKIATQRHLKFQITNEKKIYQLPERKKQIRKDQESQWLRTSQQDHCKQEENGVISRNLKKNDL